MSADKPEDPKPNPIEDLRKGLGLLFRAAKTTLEQLPTEKLEEAVVSSAKEVGRAIENVTQQVEKQIFRKPTGSAPPPPVNGEASENAKKDPNPPEEKGQ
jgi:hypothetical protein